MLKLRTTLLALILGIALGSQAQQRAKETMQRKAQQVLSRLTLQQNRGTLKALRHTRHYSVYGYEKGGYAILAGSELMPEVIGYADTPFGNAVNPNLEWYLQQIDTIAAQVEASGKAVRKAVRPGSLGFPTSVPQLMTTTWGQESPFWNLCPQDLRGNYCYTGCVATAMAQILNYHKYPPQGNGTRTITYPLNSSNPTSSVTANFGATQYDWDHMRNSYTGAYTQQEADAVATLMLHCGVAANMNYSVSGSGTFTADAAYGLREYFGIQTARAYKRSDYVTSDWLDMVYGEISGHRPILYGATDPYNNYGHAFVFDGYDEQGLVHVNWGWSGDNDGYYDIEVLNPESYRFYDNHDMIAGIYGQPLDLKTETIEVTTPGQLAAISDEAAVAYAELTITGNINGDDLRRLRYMAGRDETGRTTSGNLRVLDLSQAHIVAGGEAFLSDADGQHFTAADELPAHAFYNCQSLETLRLPNTLKRWGQGALAMCVKLEEVTVTPAPDAAFSVEGNIVFNRDKTTVLAVLPSAKAKLTIPVGVTTISDEALAGCRKLTHLSLPSTTRTLGKDALYSCTGLTELRVYTVGSVPVAGDNAFGNIDAEKCQLAVRRDMKAQFLASTGWNLFTHNAREFYTLIKPANATREYGDEDPVFGYQMEGDIVDGDPLLTTNATPLSPAGRYTITATAGTITDEAVEYGEGILIVRKAPLTIRPADAERRPGEPNPAFTLRYDGLKNEETEPEYTVLPVISTTANEQSPEGIYPITVSGGEAPNYSLTYQQGTLTVSNNATGIVDVNGTLNSNGNADGYVYDLTGRRFPLNAKLPKGIYIYNGKKLNY